MLCLFCLMIQKHCWNYFAFNQSYFAEGKIAPVVVLPHEAKYIHMILHWHIRTGSDWWFSKILLIRIGSDSILSDQDWNRTKKFHSPLISGTSIDELRGLWNFSVQVQTRSDKIESDPVMIFKNFADRIGSDSILSDKDWTRTEKFHSPLISGTSIAELRGLWNFSVQVQSRSDKIDSDPVLIRQCKVMYIYFASWGKRTTGHILPLAKYNWLKAK